MNENNTPEKTYILTMRCEDTIPENTAIGSGKGTCIKCGEEVWVAPSSMKLMEDKPLEIEGMICSRCAEKDKPTIKGPVPGALEEIMERLAEMGE